MLSRLYFYTSAIRVSGRWPRQLLELPTDPRPQPGVMTQYYILTRAKRVPRLVAICIRTGHPQLRVRLLHRRSVSTPLNLSSSSPAVGTLALCFVVAILSKCMNPSKYAERSRQHCRRYNAKGLPPKWLLGWVYRIRCHLQAKHSPMKSEL